MELAAAKKNSQVFEKKKAATEAAKAKDDAAKAAMAVKAKAQKEKAADEKRRTLADGLIHYDDGTKVDSLSRTVVSGVNLQAQVMSNNTFSLMQVSNNQSSSANASNFTQNATVAISQQAVNTT